MFRLDDSAEEVVQGERSVKVIATGRYGSAVGEAAPGKSARAKAPIAKAVKTMRPRDPLGVDAKNHNDEIPDPDLVVPE